MREENINLIGKTINDLFENICKRGLGKIDDVSTNGKNMIPDRPPHRNRIAVNLFVKNDVQLVPEYMYSGNIEPKIFVQKKGKLISVLLIESIEKLPDGKWDILDANTAKIIKKECDAKQICEYLEDLENL